MSKKLAVLALNIALVVALVACKDTSKVVSDKVGDGLDSQFQNTPTQVAVCYDNGGIVRVEIPCK